MPGDRDYYLILGIDEGATPDQIRTAYRSAARAHHPDLNPGDAGAGDRFRQVREAYDVLGDPVRRAAYRRPRPTPPNAGADATPPPWTGGNYVDAWSTRSADSERVLSPEVLEALLALRAVIHRAELQRRFRRFLRVVESW